MMPDEPDQTVDVEQSPLPAEPEVETQPPPAPPMPDNEVNLVRWLRQLGEQDPKAKEFLEKTLPEKVIRDFNEDLEARREWLNKIREMWKLWLGALEPKKEPWANCANMHVPILVTRTLRLVSRIWSEIFKQGQPIFTVVASSAISEERAQILTKHENWQLLRDITDFPKQIFRALLWFIVSGDTVTDSYYDGILCKNRHEHLTPDEFVYPYARRSSAPDMSDVPRKTRVLFPYKRDLRAMVKGGFYDADAIEKVIANDGTHDNDIDQLVRDMVDKFHGLDRSENVSDAPYTLLEYHGWVSLPGQEADMPVRVVVDPRTATVVGLFSRYYDDPEDRQRFDRETSEYQQYVSSTKQYVEILSKEQEVLAVLQQPDVPPEEAQAIANQIQMERPMPPVKPDWMQNFGQDGMPLPPAPCKQKVLERFTHGVCIENPEGSHGLGIGLLLMPHQMAANIMMNQHIDSATLANSTGAIMHEGLQIDPGIKTIDPNTIIRVRGIPIDSTDKGFIPLQHPPANVQLLEGVRMQQEEADNVSSAPDVLSGVKEGDETFRGQATRVEQAVKQLSVYASNFLMVLNQIARNNARLNFMFLPDQKLVEVMDPNTFLSEPLRVGRDLYRDDYQVRFTADLSFTSRAAKVAEADDALGLLMKGVPPQLAGLIFKPQIFPAAVRRCFQARGLHDLERLVNSDKEVQQRVMEQQMVPPGGPGMPPPGGPGMPPPTIPTGQPMNTPGTVGPQTQLPIASPSEATPNRQE